MHLRNYISTKFPTVTYIGHFYLSLINCTNRYTNDVFSLVSSK